MNLDEHCSLNNLDQDEAFWSMNKIKIADYAINLNLAGLNLYCLFTWPDADAAKGATFTAPERYLPELKVSELKVPRNWSIYWKKNKDVLSATSANNCWLTKQGVNQLRPVQTMKKERGKFRSQLLSGGRLAARVLECVFERVLESDLESVGKPLGERLWERIKYDRFVPQTNRHCYLFIVWV